MLNTMILTADHKISERNNTYFGGNLVCAGAQQFS